MTAYEFIALFLSRRRLLVGCVLLALSLSLVYFQVQPERYASELVLSVARTAPAPTAEFTYDHYYRFQADERLADTLVSYLGSRTGRERVAESAALKGEDFDRFLETPLRAARLGTNMVVIEYVTFDRALALRLGQALATTASTQVAALNEDAREAAWFTVLSEEPVIRLVPYSLVTLAAAGLVGGALVGFWAVLGSHFWAGYREHGRSKSNKQ